MPLLETKKSFKQDPVKMSLFKVPPPLTGSIFYYGKISAGKTIAELVVSQKYHDYRGYKIWDLWGGKRHEQFYWCIKSPYNEYWKLVKKRFRMNEDGAKQYRVNLLYPFTSKLPEKLPMLRDEKERIIINPKVFTIPIKTIEKNDVRCVIGNLSDENETLFENILEKLKKSEGIVEAEGLFEKLKGMNSSLYRNFFKPLFETRMLSSLTSEYNIDMKAEAKDRETITILVLNHVEERYRLFVMKYLLGQMWNLLAEGKVPTRNMINIREASEFFRASERSIVEDRFKIFKVILSDYIRYGRGKMHFNLDAQSPSEVAGLVDGSQDMNFLGKMPSEDDRKIATDQLRRDGKITSKQITDLGELEAGEFYIIEAGKVAKKRYLFLPRTLFWKEGYGNFDSIWRKYNGNSFKNVRELKKIIEEEYREMKKQVLEHQKEIKQKKHEEKKRLQEEEEERKIKERVDKERRFLLEKKKMKEELKRQSKEEKTVIQHDNSYEEVKDKKIPKRVIETLKEAIVPKKEEELNTDEDMFSEW